MRNKKFRLLLTSFLVILLTLSLAAVSFAAAYPTQGFSCGQFNLRGTCYLGSENSTQCPEQVLDFSFLDQLRALKVPCAGQNNCAASNQNAGQPVKGVEDTSWTAEEQQMLDLINRERASAGAAALKMNPELVKLARLKAQDMVDKQYFGHNSPTYGSPFDMMKKFGISYTYAGENLAMAPTVTTAHTALMNSSGHRANILNTKYDQVGIGIVSSGGNKYFVQLFTGGQKSSGQTGDDSQMSPQPGEGAGDDSLKNPATESSEASLMIQLINQQRTKLGLPKLVQDDLLTKVANLKAKDFVVNNYYAHTSPTYGSVQNMLAKFGVKYNKYAENLALSTNVVRAYNALMNSKYNRANMLSPAFGKIGVGVSVCGNNKYYVLLFTDNAGNQQPAPQEPENPPTKPDPGTPPNNPDPSDPPAGGGNSGGSTQGLTADEQRMLDLINSERAKAGLAPLKANLKLTEVARLKAKDMIAKNYFSHNSPTYGSPFEMMRQFGISYRTAGENLAGAPSVDTAHRNLMNSPGHRANILNPNYKEIGIGVLSGSQYGKIFVQMFIG